jgi:hypothetical protein
MNDEFYIGWETKAAPSIGKVIRRAVVAILLLAVLAAAVLAISQRLIGAAVFEWGNVKTFSGILQATPYPHLMVPRPGGGEFSSYYLVAPWKFGLKPEVVATFAGKLVTLKGTLIYRGNQTMVEVVDGSIVAVTNSLATPVLSSTVPLGRQKFVGEIVDSKCFLGVMNPGQLTPHRACAIRCISGGIPPVLLVRQKNGPAIYLLLVSAEGKQVNQQVLDLVAEPVEITGEVERQGELLILRADPKTYHRAGL